MAAISAGLLMCKRATTEVLFLLVHPGGPFFKKKDVGFWSIPKGLTSENEDLLGAAKREFQEETGIIPEGTFYPLGEIKQKGGKKVYGWSFIVPSKYQEWDPEHDLVSNTFTMEWPPKSGKMQTFPEIDQARWFNYETACNQIMSAQRPFLDKARAELV